MIAFVCSVFRCCVDGTSSPSEITPISTRAIEAGSSAPPDAASESASIEIGRRSSESLTSTTDGSSAYVRWWMAAVVGVPDAKSGEVVKAFIQLKPGETATEEEFKAFSKDHMAGYKRPRYIEFRDALPTSPIGKVLRRELRDEERAKQKQT